MRPFKLLALVSLAISASAAAGCAAPTEQEEVDVAEGELVQFPAEAFANAPTLTYGSTSAAIATSRTKWGVVRWNGTEGDEFVATVTPTTDDRLARAYLVEKRADGKYVAILSGTNSVDGIVRAKLQKTQTYFIVFRDRSRRNASFTVNLEKAGGLPAGCGGPALVNQEIIDRTPQAQEPGITVTGLLETSIRRCNVATGCANPVVRNNPNAATNFLRSADGKWRLTGAFQAAHDGTTGELTGTTNVTADDGRSISVALTGAATTSCVSLAGQGRTEIDAITYYDVEVSYRATTPPPAERTNHPATPPPPECDGQELIPDEEVLARFAPGTASLLLGQANVMEDSQYCHPETGCRPWARASVNFALRATANVLGPSSLGITFHNTSYGAIPGQSLLEDGTIAISGDVLRRGVAGVTYTSVISDTHLLVKETNVYANGNTKQRRYVCIPIPPHP